MGNTWRHAMMHICTPLASELSKPSAWAALAHAGAILVLGFGGGSIACRSRLIRSITHVRCFNRSIWESLRYLVKCWRVLIVWIRPLPLKRAPGES